MDFSKPLRGVTSYLKLITICIIIIMLGGCAAGKMFMAGYQPPQTIADLLNEQYALAGQIPPNGITGQAARDQKRSDDPIDRSSYKGDVSDRPRDQIDIMQAAMIQPPVQRFTPRFTYKSVQDYASQLAMDLVKNANGLGPQAKIGVSSFVKLDYTLQNTTVLGNQMAEYSISEIQQFGLNVVDFKMMPAIQVTRKGDLAFSRDIMKLANNKIMDHVLSATMIEKADGVFINARIIELGTNRVVSSASVLIPKFVSQQIHAQYVSFDTE
jgi:TolB-like protein